jgi:hypothetical protein
VSELIVIVGAGASHDSVDANNTLVNLDYQPPLTRDLFKGTQTFAPILHKYRHAMALSARIRDRLHSGDQLETILNDLATNPNDYLRKQFWEVPLYLQELIGEVSEHFAPIGSTRYYDLVCAIEESQYDRVLYVTTNYDLFLEHALETLYRHRFVDISSYCLADAKWRFVKLHGSANWGKRLLNGTLIDGRLSVSGPNLELDTDILLLTGHHGTARNPGPDKYYYPALAAPVGTKDGFVCDPGQLDLLRRRIRTCSGLLVVGFSGLDRHVLELFEDAKQVRRFGFVTERLEAGKQVFDRFAVHMPALNAYTPEDLIYRDGFARFVRSGDLNGFLAVL